MRRRPSILEAARLLGALWLLPFAASADEPQLSAVVSCDPAPAPGRVRCTLKATVPVSERLSWVDALVVQAPPFAQPLRSRVAHHGSTDASQVEIALALLATRAGEGELWVRARAVVCSRSSTGRCRPLSKDARLKLSVGG